MRTDEAVRRADDVLSSRLSSYISSAMEMARIVKQLAPEVDEARRLKGLFHGLEQEIQDLRKQLKPCEKCVDLEPRLAAAIAERDEWREKYRRLWHLSGALSEQIFEAPRGSRIPQHGIYIKKDSHDIINALREELRR